MGNFPSLTSSAGVVQKVLPKRHNRTMQRSLDAGAQTAPAQTKKTGQCPAFFLFTSDGYHLTFKEVEIAETRSLPKSAVYSVP
jgi:hypothetical protein